MEPSPVPRQRPASNEQTFPARLYAMLQDAESQGFASIVRWVDDRYFRVFDPDRFEAEVLPRYFESTKFNSFRRQLNLYNFECIREKKHRRRGCYSHPRFRRDCPPQRLEAKKKERQRPVKEQVHAAPPQGIHPHVLLPKDDLLLDVDFGNFCNESPLIVGLEQESNEQDPSRYQHDWGLAPPPSNLGQIAASAHDRSHGVVPEKEPSPAHRASGRHNGHPLKSEKYLGVTTSERIFLEWLRNVPIDIQNEILSTFGRNPSTSSLL